MTKDFCSKCGKEKYIVNMTHYLCDECNQQRLHGISRFERQKAKVKRITKVSIRKIESKKITQSQIDAEYSRIVKEITQEREPICESCGRSGLPLSISHIISRKRCKELGLISLITDKNNLLLECYGDSTCCHDNWEQRNMKVIVVQLSFDYKMSFIRKHDNTLFNILIDKANVYL